MHIYAEVEAGKVGVDSVEAGRVGFDSVKGGRVGFEAVMVGVEAGRVWVEADKVGFGAGGGTLSGADTGNHFPPLKPVLSEPQKVVATTLAYCP
ncbi:hypothetical protein PoB_006530500 [Plakobranchus ocellatus]|uniref:Uncharacterized protein n=1 Tax=Plakobranchus ocellatus TaxID=259542 RepID=A0AAV4D3T3_9GAST|nr:hypothetical protein PoB_006530500 [Plakobranchus ocellatus]